MRTRTKDGMMGDMVGMSLPDVSLDDLEDLFEEEEEEEDDDDECSPELSQAAANYNPLGGTAEKACANCMWFQSPDDCYIVENDPMPIVPGGLSDLWRAREVMTTPDLAGTLQNLADAISGESSRKRRRIKAATKTEGGAQFPAADYAVVPDPEMPSTWKLRLAESPGKQTVAQIARAITAMQPGGFRGQKVQLSGADKKQAVSRITAAIGKVEATDAQKQNLRDRLGAVKSLTGWDRMKAMMSEMFGWDAQKAIAHTDVANHLHSHHNGIVHAHEHVHGEGDTTHEMHGAMPVKARTSFKVYKDRDGQYRWLATVTNKFRDRDNPPEIFSDAAHREFVGYLDKGGTMPEAWLWHTPGTRWGQADWAEYADGFVVMSGTVDPGMEHVAKALEGDGLDLGVSHGYRFRDGDQADGVYDWYRSFEISPLPWDAAANPFTGIDVMRKESDMAFSAGKRAFLVDKLGEEKVGQLERDTTGLAKALETAGIDYKEIPDEPAPAAGVSVKDLTDALAPQFKEITEGLAGIKAQADKIPTIEAAVKDQGERIARLEKSEDQKVADLLTARSDRSASGYRASQSDGTKVADGDMQDARPMIDAGFLRSFQAGG